MSTMRSFKFRWCSRLLFTLMLLSLGLGFFTAVPASNAAVAAQFIRHSIDDNVNWLYDDIQLADMDGDDDLDAITNAFAGCLVWWENEPDNTGYWAKHILTCDYNSYAAVPADLDGDDDIDILASLELDDDIVWFENLDGSGTNWSKHHIFGHERDSDILLAVDVDGDNDLDIVAGLTYNHELAWWENLNGDASSWIKHEVIVGTSFHALAAADIDGDGDQDLLKGTYFEGEIAWWENVDGNGRSWLMHFVAGGFPQPFAIGAADMDNDGSLDIYGAAHGGHKITWWRNVDGRGQLWEAHVVAEGYERPRDVLATDIDADHDMDLVSVSTDLNQVTLWENVTGAGTAWQAIVLDNSFLDASAVTAGDIDGDNDIDVAAVAFNETGLGDNIAWWEQETAAFVVNSTGDGADAQLGDGLCDDGAGHCTLRAALMEANVYGGIDLIHFNIPGSGPHTIRPYSPLPALTEGVIVDGYTQPGAQPNSNPAPQGLNTQLKVVLDGSQAGDSFAFTFGLDTPTIDGLVIRGLVIHSFGLGAFGALYEEMYDVTNARLVGNFIGTEVTGTLAQGEGSGVYLAGGPRLKNIYVGGPSPEDRNLINGQIGVYSRYAEMIQVQGNLIGTDVYGQHALGNGGGVYVQDACRVLIGGYENGGGNVISGNRTHGIELAGNDGCTTVHGNLLGLAADGQTPLGNDGSGIYVGQHASVQIDGNRIAYNQGNGLTVVQSNYRHYGVMPNRIYNNGGLGIDLNNDGVTPNDPLDSDVGPNGLQNYPILESVIYTADSVYVTGELHSKPNQNYLLEFFTNERCDPSGYGEGEAFAKTIIVWTDENGSKRFATSVPIQAERPFITVTASLSNIYDGTSEFSNCRADPLYLITLLQAEVQQLIDEGELPLSAGTKLLTKLANVTVALQAGHENTAVLRLRDFIASVNTLMNRRQLDRALGQPLVDAAWEIIHQINLP
jgi:CSLREA domain-containing protein